MRPSTPQTPLRTAKTMVIYLHLAMLFQLLLSSVIALDPFTAQQINSRSQNGIKEPSFGIEFTLDHVISSVTLANGSTYGLARVSGGESYQSLMRHYLETCRQIHLTQASPFKELQQAFRRSLREEEIRRSRLIRQPMQSWRDYLAVVVFRQNEHSPAVFDGDEYAADPEVDVLAKAVKDLKITTVQELGRQFEASDPLHWAYARIVAPDFFWEAIEPKPKPVTQPDETVVWDDNFDEDYFWYRFVVQKFSAALYRNRFRQAESTNWRAILSSSASVAGISPSSGQIVSHSKRRHYARPEMDINSTTRLCGPNSLSPTTIVVGFSNASLSLWLDRPQSDLKPWNIFPELGGHALENNWTDDCRSNAFWDQAVTKIDALSEYIDPSSRSTVDLILSGDSWSEECMMAFQDRLQGDAKGQSIEIKNVVYQSDIYAASKTAARSGRHDLDTWDLCFFDGSDEIPRDEL